MMEKENCAQLIEEELNRIFGINDEHDCNIASMNSLNSHDASDMQSHKLGDAMFDEDDNCYTIGAIHTINDESDYAYDMKRPKLGDAMYDYDIFSPPSFNEKIYYDDCMPPIYDDYGDDMCAILNNYKHETCHHDFIF